ncbi:MAG: hypothetical protein KDD89_08820 [Anaerolineales bacterium]|nr:hypothetical protein [Anaerolineales bacterium]
MKQTRYVILRDIQEAGGSRLLSASLTNEGDVLIEGRDFGDGVARFTGSREYEWAWRIPHTAVSALQHALGIRPPDDLLLALQAQFSGENAAELGNFLETHDIPTTRWSRLGD